MGGRLRLPFVSGRGGGARAGACLEERGVGWELMRKREYRRRGCGGCCLAVLTHSRRGEREEGGRRAGVGVGKD